MIWTPSDIPGLDRKDVQHLTVTAKESWSAATLRNGIKSLIIINSAHTIGRQNNSLAHEIGHIVLRHEPAKMYLTPDGLMMMSEYNVSHEDEANWFAGAVLVPREALLDVVKKGTEDVLAAEHFGVSTKLLQMRRNQTDVDIHLSRRRGTWIP